MPGYTFHLIPHTHWDREWYLPQTVFLPRLIAALDDLFDRLTTEPELTFLLDGQTVLLEDYLRVRPERAAQAADLVRGGRLQVGPWYVLADELIPSGESLIRNLLVGKSDSDALGGRTEVLYSPDAFGHPAVWPQLAGEFGIRFGVVWRGLGGEPGQEHDLYRWRGPDGREVLLYHLPPDGYEIGAALPASLERLPRVWSRTREVLVGRATTRQVAVFIGADHHRLHPAIVDLRARLAQLEPDSQFRISRLQDFFAAAAAEANGARLIEGELRWSYGYTWTLQGVHATRAPLKRRHAETELTLLRVAEPLSALCRLFRGEDPNAVLSQSTRLLLQSEFHDSIGGCTSDEVATRVALRLDDAQKLAAEVARSSFDRLIGNDPDRARALPETAEPQLVLWNPVPRPRAGIVVADISWFRRDVLVGPPGDRIPREGPGSRPFHLISGGQTLGVQPLSRWSAHERLDASLHYPDQDVVDCTRVAFVAPEQKGFGVGALDLGNGERPAAGTAWARGRRLGNELVEVVVGSNGGLDLIDRRTRRRYRNLFVLESSSDVGDTYTFAPSRRDRLRSARGAATPRIVANGPVVAAIELRGQIRAGQSPGRSGLGAVSFRLTVSLHAGSGAVRCSYLIENQALNHRLRLRIPTGIPGGVVLAGSPFGAIERPTADPFPVHHPRETPVTTAPAQRYVAHAASGQGLAVFAPGFFEYELDKHGVIRVTLLRSVGELSRPDLETRPGHAGWPVPTPMAQCLGP
ncbi:MAG TPA: glycoside hydrolase family 38 C-terminal domain-containing protein, partial [Gemmatimonadales bacterium]|nr:glycoside hydrolase family 38 C-terminal domain-containing protein [Gemmatimonadales bacterium]